MRIRAALTSLNKKFMFLIAVGIIVLVQINIQTNNGSGNIVSVITVREIDTKNLSQLHFDTGSGSDATPNDTVGFHGLGRFNCHAAFTGKAKNSDFKGDNIKRWNVTKIKEDAEKDCERFRKEYGIDRYPQPLPEELDFPLSFSIVFHKAFDQVLYLLRAMYHPQNIYCLHLDNKSPPEMQKAAKAVAKCLPNVYLASVQENVVYASYARLKVEFNCMKDALRSPVNWRYHINMVGQQFPLKSNLEMVRILKLYNGTNDIEGIVGGARLENRYRKAYAPRYIKKSGLYRMESIGSTNPPPPHAIEIIKGSAFGTFSRAFVEYLLSDPVVGDFLDWSKTIYSPDEYVWATLQHSTSFKVPGGNNTGQPNKRLWFSTYANWGEHRCFGKRTRGICIFTTQDLPLLLGRHEFFANKFDIDFHLGALHCLDKLVYNLTTTNTVTDLGFFENLKRVKGS